LFGRVHLSEHKLSLASWCIKRTDKYSRIIALSGFFDSLMHNGLVRNLGLIPGMGDSHMKGAGMFVVSGVKILNFGLS